MRLNSEKKWDDRKNSEKNNDLLGPVRTQKELREHRESDKTNTVHV